MTNYEKVKQFMTIFNQEVKPVPKIAKLSTITLRLALIEEELSELREALINDDIVETADALADILYVVYGAAAAFGIDIDEVFEEVHDSNMSKLDNNGQPIFDEMGKVMKGHGYFHPNIAQLMIKQGAMSV
ncbi:MAG TPA: phosphoribosyl-ATP diphosphatase [Flavobacteriales bacterium]|jgi:predicted HAD superfamily Cof-like phosphohydrolase|nr:phosphoribosyl-ATP diphosphatase [Flavobacteriales bacterium]HIK68319.1 phosphoribosyl-ATP diphosphatase [Flavobacteriales bacterium]